MTGRGWRLPFRLLGIPLSLDPSFALVLPLFAWLIASQVPAYAQLLATLGIEVDAVALSQGFTPYFLGLLAALGLFTSVVIHELGHAMTARAYGVATKGITLWFLGGVAQLEDMPRQRGAEAVVAIVGPITSALLGGLLGLLLATVQLGSAATFVIAYLAITNVFLALFNLLPALPLDGGRVLRSLLALALPRERATAIAGGVSKVLAILLGVYGFLSLNLLLMVLAFFVYNAGRAEVQYETMRRTFEGRRVREFMSLDPITVDQSMPLDRFRALKAWKKHKLYPIVDQDERLLGVAHIAEAETADAGASLRSLVRDAEIVGPEDDMEVAVRRLANSELGRLIVVDEDRRVAGVLAKTDVVRALERAR
jgi:Zn-dependent protease